MPGAGRSRAPGFREDTGYETLDNLPVSLVPTLVSSAADGAAIAIGADARTRGLAVECMINTLANVVRGNRRARRALFIDCDDDRLEQRYTETPRPHSLAGGCPIMDGIRRERQLPSLLQTRAALLFDTSNLTATQLKRLLIGHFALGPAKLRVFVTSFCCRAGLSRKVDLVFGVRFLEPPYYIDGVRRLTGCGPAGVARIERDAGFADFFDRPQRLLPTLPPRCEASGKTCLTIAIDCIGGRYRPVCIAGRWAACLGDAGWQTEPAHRDLSSHAADAPDMAGANAAGVH